MISSLTLLLFTSLIIILLLVPSFFLYKYSRSLLKLEQSLHHQFDQQKLLFKDEFQRNRSDVQHAISQHRKELQSSLSNFEKSLRSDSRDNREELTRNLLSFENKLDHSITKLLSHLQEKFLEHESRNQERLRDTLAQLKDIRNTLEKQLIDIRHDNEKQLSGIRQTVDDKLQNTLEKRLGESFKIVSERLELVHKGLGEMQTIASGVGDLKKVLSNVKTRGILGEYQLANILEEILTPEQYQKDVVTVPGHSNYVEYAIKLPGHSLDHHTWLPIDSKFPIEPYEVLLSSYENHDSQTIESSQKKLIQSIDSFAKDISSKYISPPHTTDFALMFLPIESLFAEVLRTPGLFEKIQSQYRIIMTGPTTLSAVLNSLQMGFRTLAVQQRSSEVWEVLGAVKTEFNKFADQLHKVHSQLDRAKSSLEVLKDTRTNQIIRKLKQVESIDHQHSQDILSPPSS